MAAAQDRMQFTSSHRLQAALRQANATLSHQAANTG